MPDDICKLCPECGYGPLVRGACPGCGYNPYREVLEMRFRDLPESGPTEKPVPKVTKCPVCGTALPRKGIICPSCGYET